MPDDNEDIMSAVNGLVRDLKASSDDGDGKDSDAGFFDTTAPESPEPDSGDDGSKDSEDVPDDGEDAEPDADEGGDDLFGEVSGSVSDGKALRNELAKSDYTVLKRHDGQDVALSDSDALRSTLYGFFGSTISKVDQEEALLTELKASFLNDIKSNSLDFAERQSLYQMLTSKQNNQINSILSLFRPTVGVPSFFADNIPKPTTTDDQFQKAFDDSSSQDLQKLAKLLDLIQLSDTKK